MNLLRKLRSLFRKDTLEADMAEEMRLHVELQTERNLAAGMPPDEARYAALRQFGNVASIQEQAREVRGWLWLEQLGQDTGFVLRALVRVPGFALTVWATLVVGIGLATAVINLTAPIIFSPPYPQADQLRLVGYKDKQNPFMALRTGLHLQAYQEQTAVFSAYAAVKWENANIVVAGKPLVADVLSASIDCFGMLGIRPVMGRGFRAEEHIAGTDQVVILSGHFWRQHFNGDPEILGRSISVGSQVCTVIGVFGAGQAYPPAFAGDIYRPLVLRPDPAHPFTPLVYIIGRLRPGVTEEQAQAELDAVTLPPVPPWAAAFFAEQQTVLKRPMDIARPETQWIMLIAAGLLYALACLNAMNLMLVRLLGRRQEISIRFSLGGSRWQIARLLLLEGLGLVGVAGVTVLFAARWLFPPLFATVTRNEALRWVSYWDGRVAGCVLGLSLLACAGMVLAPLWRISRVDPGQGLKDGGRAMGGSRQLGRLRATLVMLQTALAVVLLAGTGLLVRSFERIRQVDLGFDPTGLVKAQVAFPPGFAMKPQARLQLFDRLADRLATLPGVRSVSPGQDALLVGSFWGTAQLLMADGSYQPVAGSLVAENFLKTAGLTLKSGRWLGNGGTYEVVINESLARARFGEEDPVGKSIRLLVSGGHDIPVVGVVKDVRETLRASAGMRLYSPAKLFPPNVGTLLLRLDDDPAPAFDGVVRQAIYEIEPQLIVPYVKTLNGVVGDIMWAERNALHILRGLSLIALGLAAVGLFSVIAFTVDSRTREFGVRLALGARPGNLHCLVLKGGVTVVALGIVLGTGCALGLTRYMQSLLFETTPNEPVVYLAVAAVLLIAAALACWLPARRAARVDPAITLRAE